MSSFSGSLNLNAVFDCMLCRYQKKKITLELNITGEKP